MQAHDPRNPSSELDSPSGTVFGRLFGQLMRTPAWRAGCWCGFAVAGGIYVAAAIAGAIEAQLAGGVAMGVMIATLYAADAAAGG